MTTCGDREETADGDVLVCDREAGHKGPHSCVVVKETRMRWLGADRPSCPLDGCDGITCARGEPVLACVNQAGKT